MIRVMLVDDHPMMRAGLKVTMELESDLQVVAEGSSAEEAVALFSKHRPDVVLMDLRLPGMSGIQAIQAILKQDQAAKIIVVTTYDGDEDVRRAFRAGAKAYLIKDMLRRELVDAIRLVFAGETHVSERAYLRLAQENAQALSAREIEVLQLVADGRSNREIASFLGISEGTVRIHLSNIFDKMGVHDRTKASIIAIQRGFIQLK
jgi:DNA-binding NarL/FixJ family response regulator